MDDLKAWVRGRVSKAVEAANNWQRYEILGRWAEQVGGRLLQSYQSWMKAEAGAREAQEWRDLENDLPLQFLFPRSETHYLVVEYADRDESTILRTVHLKLDGARDRARELASQAGFWKNNQRYFFVMEWVPAEREYAACESPGPCCISGF